MDKEGLSFALGSGCWDGDREVVAFAATDAHGPVACAVSREALDDFSATIDRQGEPPLAIFAEFEAVIWRLANRRWLRGETEPDGSILVRTEDRANLHGRH